MSATKKEQMDETAGRSSVGSGSGGGEGGECQRKKTHFIFNIRNYSEIEALHHQHYLFYGYVTYV